MLYHIGDWALVRVNQAENLVFDVDFYNSNYLKFPIREFEIIGHTTNDYYILAVPDSITQDTLTLDQSDLNKWNIDSKYLTQRIVFVLEMAVGGRRTYDPYTNALSCSLCEEIYPYAIPNRPDGLLICWSCRSTKKYLIQTIA